MDFDLDPLTEEMCRTVVRFAQHELNRGLHEPYDAHDFRRRWRLAGRQGLLGCAVPAEHGGDGLGAVAAAALMEALGYGCRDTGFAFSVAAHQFACLLPLAELGTEEQKRRWLPPLCSGEQVAAYALTEPGAGSDALTLHTRAERRGDEYVLTGGKCFITNAPAADVFIVQAATEPGAGYFGVSAFVIEAGTPGLNVSSLHGKVGLTGSPTGDVYLDECAVPADQLLGAEGAGAGVFATSMRWERTCLFAIYLGAMKRVLEGTVQHVTEREQFGVPIGSFQAVAHRVVEMKLRYESARLLLYRAARGIDDGVPDDVGPALAKLAVSEAAVSLGLDAVQLRGALGVLDGDAETFLRDALPARIFSGTNEIQRNNVARAMGIGARRPRARRR
jgi:alkylation response protein AidB-like acyl-CoA dehydrogenase